MCNGYDNLFTSGIPESHWKFICDCNLCVQWFIAIWNFQKLHQTCTQNQFQFLSSVDINSFGVFFQITFQYENDLLEELAFKFFDYDENCLPNGISNVVSDSAVVNNIQAKLLRMENAYAKRVKIQGICYKKKLSDFQHTIMELNRQMQVSACVWSSLALNWLIWFCGCW